MEETNEWLPQLPTLREVIATLEPQQGNEHIKRPPNCWILFRTWYCKSNAADNGNGHQHTVSKVAGWIWRNAPEWFKDHFRRLQTEIEEEHRQTYSSYKYQPVKRTEKGRAKKGTNITKSQRKSKPKRGDAVPNELENDILPNNHIFMEGSSGSSKENARGPTMLFASSMDMHWGGDSPRPNDRLQVCATNLYAENAVANQPVPSRVASSQSTSPVPPIQWSEASSESQTTPIPDIVENFGLTLGELPTQDTHLAQGSGAQEPFALSVQQAIDLAQEISYNNSRFNYRLDHIGSMSHFALPAAVLPGANLEISLFDYGLDVGAQDSTIPTDRDFLQQQAALRNTLDDDFYRYIHPALNASIGQWSDGSPSSSLESSDEDDLPRFF